MNTPLIEQAITGYFGKRCHEQEPGCPLCAAWHELDTLKARSDKYETTLPTVEEIQSIYADAATRQDAELFRWFFSHPAGKVMFLIKGLSEFDSINQWRSAMQELSEEKAR